MRIQTTAFERPTKAPKPSYTALLFLPRPNPKAVVNSDGRVEVFVVGTDNAVWHIEQSSAGSSQWSGWTTLGGYILGDIYPIVDSDALVNLFVVGGDSGGWWIQQSMPDTWQ